MCNEISKSSGFKCRLQPNKKVCSIHRKTLPIIEHREIEIKNLNKTIENKNIQIKELDNYIEDLKIKLQRSEKQVHNLKCDNDDFEDEIDRSNNQIEDLNETIDTMTYQIRTQQHKIIKLEKICKDINMIKEGYKNYMFIRHFERIRKDLIKFIDPENYEKFRCYCNDPRNFEKLERIFGRRMDDYNKTYLEMRLKRNRLAHI